MSKTLKKNLPLILAVMLVLSLFLMIGFGLSNATIAFGNSDPDETTGVKETFTMAQISDIHYFSLDYCYAYYKDELGNIKYVDKTSESFLNSTFNLATYGDTKLVSESGTILAATIKAFVENAKAAVESGVQSKIDAIPDVLITTGDLSKNSERIALIDVANALRFLQNQMRLISGFENFQVFAVPGNHDLYNSSCAIYENEGADADGHKIITDTLDTKTFAQIFESLGFPEYDKDTQTVAYTKTAETYTGGKNADEYWSSIYTGGYVTSSLAKNIKIHYYSDEIQAIADKGTSATDVDYRAIKSITNTLTYAVEFFDNDVTDSASKSTGYTLVMADSSIRVESEKIIAVAVSNEEINSITSNNVGNYYYLNDTGTEYVAFTKYKEFLNALANNKTIYYTTGLDHITGGRITTETLDWLENLLNEFKANASTNEKYYANMGANYEDTIIIGAHHNFLPHFDMEDELVKDFTLYNWEYTVKRLLAMGVRYGYSGHMHTSDMQSYVDAEGRVFFDYQTGSSVSYASPTRIMEFDRLYTTKNHVAEDATSTLEILSDFKAVPSQNLATVLFDDAKAWVDVDVTGMTTEEAFYARLNSNPDYFIYCLNYDEISKDSYNDYINELIYNRLVDRMVTNFVSNKTIDSLRNTLSTFLNDDFQTMVGGTILKEFASYGPALNYVAQDLIDQILYDIDYKKITNYITGEKIVAEDAISFLKEIVESFITLEFGEENNKMNVKEIVAGIITRHNSGTEIQGINKLNDPSLNELESDKRYAAAIKDFCAQANNGTLIEKLINTLLSPLLTQDDSLLKQLFNYQFDFSAIQTKYNLSDSTMKDIKEIFNLVKNLIKADSFGLNNFKLSEILGTAIVGNLISGLLNDYFGVDMGDNNLIEFAEDFIGKYMTDSLFTNLGGYVKQIVVAFATDETADIMPIADAIKTYGTDVTVEEICAVPCPLRYTINNAKIANYAVVGDAQFTYVQGQTVPDSSNIATVLNGRLPSHFIAAFDNEAPQTTFNIKFYTAEEVFAYIQIFEEDGTYIGAVSTLDGTLSQDTTTYNVDAAGGYYLNSYKNSSTIGDIKIEAETLTVPCYVPLIDLGVLCLTHAEVDYETTKVIGGKETDVEYVYGATQRDAAEKNSVIFNNRNAISISGLAAGKTYKYRVYGVSNGIDGNNSFDATTNYYSLTDYVYDIKDNPQNANYSVAPSTILSEEDKTFSFKTALDTSDSASFDFIAMADPQGTIQSNYDYTKDVFDAISRNDAYNNYSFITNAGDMTDNGKNYLQWSLALDTMVEYYANTTLFMTAGNHENGSNAFENFLTQTAENEQNIEDGMYYSFTYGNTHFVVLNTNDSDSKNGLGAKQIEWLKTDLSNDNSTWTMVILHKSLYSVGSHTNDGEVVKMREQLTKLFADYDVDIVIQGHDHTYSSTMFINANGEAMAGSKNNDGYVVNANGVMYMTLGTIGNKYYDYVGNDSFANLIDDSRTIAHTLDTQTFASFSVDGDKLVIRDCIYDASTGAIKKFGELKLTKENGNVSQAVESIKINGENLKLNSTIKVDYAKRTATLDMTAYSSALENGSKIQIVNANGEVVTELKADTFKKATAFTVQLVTASGEIVNLGNVTLERENYTGAVAGISVAICVVILGAIGGTLAIIIVKRRQKPLAEDALNDNSNNEL